MAGRVEGVGDRRLDGQEKLAFSDAFSSYRKFAQLREQEDEIWRRLGALNHPDLLGQADWPALHQAYGEALAMNERIQDHSAYVLSGATLDERPSRLSQTPADVANMKAFCAPLID